MSGRVNDPTCEPILDLEPLPLQPGDSPGAGVRGRAGIPAAHSANSTRKSPLAMTYRPSSRTSSSGTWQTRLSPFGSTPLRISARAASRGASLVGDSSPIGWPSSPSSQYAVASSISTIDGWSSKSLKARRRSSSERAGFVRMSFALRGAPCGDDANSTLSCFGGHHRDEPALRTVANDKDALLGLGVVEIDPRNTVWVLQRGPRLQEAHAVLGAVDALLPLVPSVSYHAVDRSGRRLSSDQFDKSGVSRG